MSRFIIFNEKVVDRDEVNLTHLLQEEHVIISQKCWFGYGGIPLISENIDLMIRQIEVLQLPCPEILKNKRELFRITKRMLNKNKFYRSGFVHFQFFWNNGNFNSLISSMAFIEFEFPLSNNGILVNYIDFKKHSQIHHNRYSFFNKPLWKAAELHLHNTVFHNSIFVNENNSVCDCISANIFLIKEKTLYTPSIQTGCFEDTLRNIILEIAAKNNFTIIESSEIKKEDVLQMNEIFIASEELGIQWILGVENKRFIHHYSSIIHEKLNDNLKNAVN